MSTTAEESTANPEPGTETEAAYAALTRGDGYTVLKGLIEPEQAWRVRDTLLSYANQADHDNDGILRLSNLLVLDDIFLPLVTNERLLAMARRVLGPDARLAAVGGRILMPDCDLGGLHVDYPYWAMDPGMPVEPSLMMQVIWMMEPFTAENGGTWVAPTSQTWGEYPKEARFKEAAVQASGNAGDAVVSHGLLWHRTAVNQAEAPRVAMLINYSQLAIQPMTPMGPFSDDFKRAASPELRSLLGFDHGKALRRRAMQVAEG
ncbi:MAG: phytanoyl-CoA dioxygenase family protein [Pseudomonadota bacterium]